MVNLTKRKIGEFKKYIDNVDMMTEEVRARIRAPDWNCFFQYLVPFDSY